MAPSPLLGLAQKGWRKIATPQGRVQTVALRQGTAPKQRRCSTTAQPVVVSAQLSAADEALDQVVDPGGLFHVHHVTGGVQHVHADARRQALAMADRDDPVLPAPDHLNRYGELAEAAGQLQGLLAA